MYKIKIESNNARFGGLIGLMVLNIALLNVINLAGEVLSRETYPRSSRNPCSAGETNIFFGKSYT